MTVCKNYCSSVVSYSQLYFALSDRKLPSLYLTATTDFPQQTVSITIPASTRLSRNFRASVAISDDNINEASEIFLLLVQPAEETANDPEAPSILTAGGGLTIARIVNDDS